MIFAFFAMLGMLVVQANAANATMKGDGSVQNPFQIDDYEDLKAIGQGNYLYSSSYILTADIDATLSQQENCDHYSCFGFAPIGMNRDAEGNTDFTGNFDGKNHTISPSYLHVI